jgi:hypothetical protein
MTRPTVMAAALLGAFLVAACATKRVATSELVRQTKDGGTIVLHPGAGPQAAARVALSSMETQCKGPFEIVETAKTGTGRTVTVGSSGSEWGITSFESSNGAKSGMSLTYLCRKPMDTSLNDKFAAFASQDLLGKQCASDRDCGVYSCTASKAPAGGTICTAADGSIPFAMEGEECDQKPCIAPFTCYKTYKHGSGTSCKSQ